MNTLFPGCAHFARRTRRSSALAGVTKDATSGIYMPANATEWAAVLSVAGITSGGPSLLWRCNEASGNLADSIGSFTGTATAGSPALAYQQAVPGWAAKGISATDATTGNILTTSSSLPDISTTSMAVLAYQVVTATPASVRTSFLMGTTALAACVSAASRDCVNNGALTPGSSAILNVAEPRILQQDVTHQVQALFTLNDKVVATWAGTRTGKQLKLFSGPPASTVWYLTAFFGASAELTAAQWKTLLKTLAWAPTWN